MSDHSTLYENIPDPPEIPPDLLKNCRESEDYRQILFEYYKFVAMLCVLCSQIMCESPSWTGKGRLRWTVLVGLLTRCHRIMGGHLEFWQDERYGDLSTIFDRCLLETCTKIRWISEDRENTRLRRYIEDGLKAEYEQLQEIDRKIRERGGKVLVIEERMRKSILQTVDAAGLSEDELKSVRKGPPLAAMFEDLGERRFVYTVVGKLASHSVHGSWTNLLHSYLEGEDADSLTPRMNPPLSHINQYVYNSLFVLEACISFLSNNFRDEVELDYLLAVLISAREDVWEMNLEIIGGDFEEMG